MESRSIILLLVVCSLVLYPGCKSREPSSQELEIEVPGGVEVTLDGVLSPDEWDKAYKDTLCGCGELFLMQDGDYLYLGVRGKPEPVTSVFVLRDSEVLVLHSSAALGTATYQRDTEGWKCVREFSWRCRDTSNSQRAVAERADHLEEVGWVGSTGRMGAAQDVEMKIRMPEGKLILSVTSIGAPDYEEVSWWPPRLEDGCRNLDLIRGSPPKLQTFSVEQWAVVTAGS